MDVDQVDNLIKFCPTKEEMELLKVCGEDISPVVIPNLVQTPLSRIISDLEQYIPMTS